MREANVNVKYLLRFSAIVSVAAAAAANASAQTTPSGAGGPVLGEVIVTAQRRSERLEEVPISVTALSGAELARAGVQDLRDLQTVAPSLQVSSTGVFTQLAIRGISSTAIGPGIENNIAVYVDGVYQPDSAALGSDFANVDNVQILKGPQGTLYGRNATGGALLISTLEPTDQHPIIQAEAGYGNLNDRRVRTYLGAPIRDGLSVGLGAYYRANDGYIKNIDGSDAAPYQDVEIRAKVKWEPTSDLSFLLGFNYFHKSDPVALAYSEQAFSPLHLPVGPHYTNQIDKVSVAPNPTFTVRLKETTFRAIWNTDYGSFTAHTAYQDERPHFDSDYDATTLHIEQIPATFNRHTFIQQLDYNVKPIPTLQIQAGALYFKDQSSDNASVLLFAPPVTTAFSVLQQANTTMRTTAYAGYIDATWEAIPHLFLNAGVRYSKDERTIEGYYIQAAPIIARITPHYPIEAFPTSAAFPATTPRATVRYEFAPQTNVYFSFAKGFKSGTFNAIARTPADLTTPVQPEKITAYEVGLKTAQSTFRFETAAFYYDYKDLQVNSLNDEPGFGVVTVLTNAATAKIWGLEGSGAWAVTPNFNLRAGVAYTHARYGDFPNATVSIPLPLANPTAIVQIGEDFSGQRIARAPDWTANIGADYTIPIGDGRLVIAGNGYYSSAYAPTTEAYNPATGQPYYYDKAYFIANFTVDYTRDRYTLGAWVNDLGDARFPIVNAADTFGYHKVLSSPRTFGVRVAYSY
jgi:iron complex outermembrane receptor protein